MRVLIEVEEHPGLALEAHVLPPVSDDDAPPRTVDVRSVNRWYGKTEVGAVRDGVRRRLADTLTMWLSLVPSIWDGTGNPHRPSVVGAMSTWLTGTSDRFEF